MKTKTKLLFLALAAALMVFSACKKETHDLDIIPTGDGPYNPTADQFMAGLGSNPGYPTGTAFVLPTHVKIIGDIRGGLQGKSSQVDKQKYQGPFPIAPANKSWIDYGTGTFVSLYIKFYNTLPTVVSLTIPGGLIFVDSLDLNTHIGQYQKGYILQSVIIPLPAQDTAFVHLNAYCLNHTLWPSSYNAIYFIGPITNNPELNQITSIMAPKQYPFGEEWNIQSVIWDVTDYGLTLSTTQIQYLNSLP